MAIRSGRFKFTVGGPGSEQVIIKSSKSGTFYRIFNSGRKDFIVKNGGKDPWSLAPTFSLDLVVDQVVAITGNANEEVEGIYEYLDNQIVGQTLRSGRFSFKDPNAPPPKHKIIDLTHATPIGAYYRIFNSGDAPFELWLDEPAAGKDPLASIAREQSLDFEIVKTGSAKDIWVAGTPPFEGIYDFLGMS